MNIQDIELTERIGPRLELETLELGLSGLRLRELKTIAAEFSKHLKKNVRGLTDDILGAYVDEESYKAFKTREQNAKTFGKNHLKFKLFVLLSHVSLVTFIALWYHQAHKKTTNPGALKASLIFSLFFLF